MSRSHKDEDGRSRRNDDSRSRRDDENRSHRDDDSRSHRDRESRSNRNGDDKSNNDRHRKDYRDRERYRSNRDRDSDDDYNRDKYRSKRRHSSDERDEKDRRRPKKENSNYNWGGKKESSPKPVKEKEKPNFETTGKLAEEVNTYRGVVIKYSEPEEARKPKRRWRLYPFKGDKALPVLYIHRQSGYLIGRERKIADIAVDHPSCSKQHAALQYRLVSATTESGATCRQIRPYIMDLESANGTYLNGNKIEPKRYYELFEKDVLKFGYSSREYVLLHEHSADAEEDDNMTDEIKTEIKTEPE